MEFSQLLRAARQFERVFAQRISPVLERCGLTIGEMRVLLFLANNPGCDTARDMVMVRGLGKSQVSQAVELLVEEHKKHPGNPYMFPSPKTGGMFDPDSFRHTHEKILKAIGTEHIRFHDLRHTFATLSLKNGVDVKTLSSTLGHYSAGFTLSTYTHATPDMMREAADTMGDVIGKAI